VPIVKASGILARHASNVAGHALQDVDLARVYAPEKDGLRTRYRLRSFT
jgi:hypothetical protein